MPIGRLNHVQFTVPSDRETEARTFYLDILGLSEIPKPDSLIKQGGFWVALDNIDIHISLQDDVDRLSSKSHLAYQVEDLTHWRNILIKSGIAIIESIPIPGYDRFEFRDPFGNRVEMIQPINES